MRSTLSVITLAFALTLPAGEALAQRQHTVRPGQSLSTIARRHRVSVHDLAAANRIRRNSTLRPGQSLTIPPRGVTYVRPGQTLSHVAREHGCTVDELRRVNRLRPGRPLRAGQELMLPGHERQSDAAAVDRDWGEPSEPGHARIRRRDGVRSVELIDEESRVTRAGLETLAELMRRHETDEPELPHPRLVHLLAVISDHFGGREITLVSGRRAAGGYTQATSRHVASQAIDIRVAGVPRRAVWEFCRSLALTGCGYYPRSTFVHVDVRARATQWVDWSAPGQRPRMGNLRGPWRRARRGRRAARPREGRRVTRAELLPEEVTLTEEARRVMPVIPALSDAPDTEEEDDEAEAEPDGEPEA